jgi:hypothetical protein
MCDQCKHHPDYYSPQYWHEVGEWVKRLERRAKQMDLQELIRTTPDEEYCTLVRHNSGAETSFKAWELKRCMGSVRAISTTYVGGCEEPERKVTEPIFGGKIPPMPKDNKCPDSYNRHIEGTMEQYMNTSPICEEQRTPNITTSGGVLGGKPNLL